MSRSFIGLACIAVSALLSVPVAAQTLSPVRVATIDPTADDFGDLEALERDIGDACIVMLGEPSHGDGGAFIAKARVIRFLHERMGFDVLAFEGGMGVLNVAQEAVQAGDAPSAALMRSILPVWGRSDQLKPLGDYLDRAQRLGDPLTLAGFDMQEVGPAAADLADSIEGLGSRAPDGADAFSRLGLHLRAMATGGMRALRERDLTTVSQDVAVAQSAVASLPTTEASRWRQQFASIEAFLEFMRRIEEGTAEVFNKRDEQMASNLRWLMTTAGPDRKVIVWAATSHSLRDRGAIDPATDATREMVPMGAHIHREFGDDAYVLAFTAGGGKIGSWARRTATDIGAPPAGSVEDELLATTYDYAFSPLAPSVARRVSWMLGYQPMPAWWDRAVDGVFFIREMTPTTYPQ